MKRTDISIKSLTSLLLSLFIIITFFVIISVVAKIFLTPERKMIILFNKITSGNVPDEFTLLPHYDIIYDNNNKRWYLIKVDFCYEACLQGKCRYSCTERNYKEPALVKNYNFRIWCSRKVIVIKIIKEKYAEFKPEYDKYRKLYQQLLSYFSGCEIDGTKNNMENCVPSIISLRIEKIRDYVPEFRYVIYLLALQKVLGGENGYDASNIKFFFGETTLTCSTNMEDLAKLWKNYVIKTVTYRKKEDIDVDKKKIILRRIEEQLKQLETSRQSRSSGGSSQNMYPT